jgi:hypothetical protein
LEVNENAAPGGAAKGDTVSTKDKDTVSTDVNAFTAAGGSAIPHVRQRLAEIRAELSTLSELLCERNERPIGELIAGIDAARLDLKRALAPDGTSKREAIAAIEALHEVRGTYLQRRAIAVLLAAMAGDALGDESADEYLDDDGTPIPLPFGKRADTVATDAPAREVCS